MVAARLCSVVLEAGGNVADAIAALLHNARADAGDIRDMGKGFVTATHPLTFKSYTKWSRTGTSISLPVENLSLGGIGSDDVGG